MNKIKGNNLWDDIAEDFGKIGPSYWNKFGNRLIELSNINQGSRVLDIGMGRGASLFPAIDKVGSEGFVFGIDNSDGMVSETNKDLIERKITNGAVKIMNAERLFFENSAFDNVVCGFGLGYLLLSDNRLNEVKRVLKAGGQVAFSVWREQQDQRWLTEIVERYLLNKIDNVNKDKKKVNKLDNVRDVIEALNICGFKNTKGYEENNEVIYRDKEEWWQEMNANAVKGIFDQIEALGTIQYDEFKKEVYLGLERFQRKEGLLFNMPVIYVYGEK